MSAAIETVSLNSRLGVPAMLQGFKTILVNLGFAILPAGLQYLGMVDWSFLGPIGAFVAMAAVNVVLRTQTKTPIFQKG
jgi:hypothetical protein